MKTKYRVKRTAINVYQPQIKWMFWWANLDKAYTSLGEATKAINIHHAKLMAKHNKKYS